MPHDLSRRATLPLGLAFALLCTLAPASPPERVAELRFAQVFKLPAGPRGLEPTPEFLALDGRVVRIAGYKVRAAVDRGGFIIAPFPLSIGDDDESLSDDLPASALYVRSEDQTGASDAAAAPQLIVVTGVLRVGAVRAGDGRLLPAQIDARPNNPRTPVTP